MIKISSREIIDIVKFSENKIIFVEKMPLADLSQYKVNYYIINFENGEKEVITKKAYLLKKFGYAFEKISNTISNFVECESVIFPSKDVLVVFPNGQAGLFDRDGEIIWNRELSYNDKVISSLAPDSKAFWCVCRDEDCVIRYNAENYNIDIRIGSKGAGTFTAPKFVSADDENVYVCCSDSKVRKINKDNLTVSDVEGNFDGVERYYKFGRFSIICTQSGAYIDKDE